MSLIAGLLAVAVAFGGTVTSTLSISPAEVVRSDDNGYAVLDLDLGLAGAVRSWTSVPGEPLLPLVSGNVLIPAGAEVEEITIAPLARTELGTHRVHPVQPMRPLSQFASIPFVPPVARAWTPDEVFPAPALEAVPAGTRSGYRLAGFRWCPFEYRPASGRLTLVTRAELTVRYRENAVPVSVLTPAQDRLFSADVAALVLNPGDLARMAPPVAETDAAEVDVVMFTSATLAPALTGLRQWLARKGYFTEIVRHDTLSTPGRDTQEKMRNLVKRLYAEQGLKYVILAGDYQHCPVRYGYLPYTSYNVPADMYFGDLDGSWDASGNNRFGEMEGDSLDLFHDVYVGRLPFDDASHAASFLRKDTTYEKLPDTASLDDVLLPHEVLWSNIDYHGGIVNRNIALLLNNRSPWQVDSGLNLNSSRVITGLNAGRQHFHFAGHGSRTAFGSTFSTSNLTSLTNVTKPAIVVSMACDCGWFDDANDCLGEQFVTVANGGAVATMLNARYGWGAPPCQGPNENLNCQIYHNFQKALTLGQSHGLARDFLRNESYSQMSTRWALYTNTLQGDPTMAVHRGVPMELEVDFPDSISAVPQTLSADVRFAGAGQAARARVALTRQGELVARAVTGSDGVATLAIPALEESSTLELMVTAPDGRPFAKAVAVGAGHENALVVYSHARVDDPDGRLDPGEESDLYLVVRNRGNAAAAEASGVLSSGSPYLTVVGGSSSYGDVAVGDTAAGDAYRVRVSRDCPHGHRAELNLIVTASDGLWRSELALAVGLPHGRGGNWAVLDTGDYVLSVMNNGGIGTTEWRGEGFGFIYPKSRSWSNTALMHGALVLGTDTGWVADNYYGAPDWRRCPLDFAPGDSVRPVWPPELGAKQFVASFTDSNHPSPRGLDIAQRAYGSAVPAHRDFVILEYRIRNRGAEAVEGLYAAVACDFRTGNWNVNDQYDYAGTDSARILAYVRSQPETTALGIRPIWPQGMNGWANCISNTAIADGFTKAEKMGYMDGTLRSTTGPTIGNWHAMASSGPYAIPAGDSQIVAFVLVGGRTVAGMLANSDSAEAWYDPPVAVAEGPRLSAPVAGLGIRSRLFTDALEISSQAPLTGPVRLVGLDASGRVCAEHLLTPAAGAGMWLWRPDLRPGVYFIRLGGRTEKVVKLR
ncbi:MAG: C25 family cysteine peptidase [bacterium]